MYVYVNFVGHFRGKIAKPHSNKNTNIIKSKISNTKRERTMLRGMPTSGRIHMHT